VRVQAQNESGQTQYAFDCYLLDTGKVYGTKSFYVDGNGQIVEDIYVEE
jgi:spore coat protein H